MANDIKDRLLLAFTNIVIASNADLTELKQKTSSVSETAVQGGIEVLDKLTGNDLGTRIFEVVGKDAASAICSVVHSFIDDENGGPELLCLRVMLDMTIAPMLDEITALRQTVKTLTLCKENEEVSNDNQP